MVVNELVVFVLIGLSFYCSLDFPKNLKKQRLGINTEPHQAGPNYIRISALALLPNQMHGSSMSITSSLSPTPNDVLGKIFNGLHISIAGTLFLLCLIFFNASSNNYDHDHS